jgi:hypothetical protein
MHPAREIAIETCQTGQVVGGRAPFAQGLKRQFPELLCGAGPEQMGAPVDGVNGLPVWAFTGKIGR